MLIFPLVTSLGKLSLQEDLRVKLAHARFDPAYLNVIVRACAKKRYEKVDWQNCFGPSPVRIAYLSPNGETFYEGRMSIAFWPCRTGTSFQVLDRVPFLGSDEPYGYVIGGEAYRSGDRLVRVGWANAGGNWDCPMIRIYCLKDERWRPTFSLDPDSGLNAADSAHFLRRKGKLDTTRVISSVRVYPNHLDEPHAGPLLIYKQTYRLLDNRAIKVKSKLVSTAVAALDNLAACAQSGNRKRFNLLSPQNNREKLWMILQDKIDVTGNEDSANEKTADFSAEWWNIKFHFVKLKGVWRLTRTYQVHKHGHLFQRGIS